MPFFKLSSFVSLFLLIFSIIHIIPSKSQLLIHSTHQPKSLLSSSSRFRQCACPTRSSSPLIGGKAAAAPQQKFLPKMLQGTSSDILFDKNLIDGFLSPLKPSKEEKKHKGTGRSGRDRPKREANKIVDLALADPEKNKCNSERLRQIILKARGRDSTALKRNIQALAERALSARFSVICARNDFSYISNTEEFCQEKVNGNICYVFKQAGRELAFPDPPKLEQFKRGTLKKNKENNYEEREKEIN